MSLKICFLAPSTFGKSTAVDIFKKNFNEKIKNIKIAEPLYYLQSVFYDFIGKDIEGKQDGELLQFYGVKIRQEKPEFLLNYFKQKIDENSDAKIILNDDCRPYDYDFLKLLGFIFIRINGQYRNREDHSPIDKKAALEWQTGIPCDYEVNNLGTLEEYEENILQLFERIIDERQVLHNPCTKHL
jgi:hypothetical protein